MCISIRQEAESLKLEQSDGRWLPVELEVQPPGLGETVSAKAVCHVDGKVLAILEPKVVIAGRPAFGERLFPSLLVFFLRKLLEQFE